MTTLVTGGTGFVGINIVKVLAERGHEVICFDRVAPQALHHEFVKLWADRITFFQGDLRDQEDLNKFTGHGITKIVHAAALTGIFFGIETERSREVVDINFMGTTNVLELARQLPIERFLYVSSGAVYGWGSDPDTAVSEDIIPQPGDNLYTITKYASEMLTRRYGELQGFPTVSTRIGTPYGPMDRKTYHLGAPQTVLKEWTGNIVRGEPIEVVDRDVEWTYTYVADTANGIATVLDADSLSYDVYNIATEERESMGNIAQILEDLQPGLRVIDGPSNTPPYGGYNLSPARLHEDLGFAPCFDLRSGIRDYLAWRRVNNFTE